MNTGLMDRFIDEYRPGANLKKPDKELLDFGEKMLPGEILSLWEDYGFGEYGNGFIKVVDPRDYMHSLYTWLGKQDFSKIPLMISAFGDIFYYRKLSDKDNDISMLDIHYRKIDVCAYSYQDFFAGYILDDGVKENILRRTLFDKAVNKHGALAENECFYFVPALVTGGAEDIKYIQKGDANVHQHMLFELGDR